MIKENKLKKATSKDSVRKFSLNEQRHKMMQHHDPRQSRGIGRGTDDWLTAWQSKNE